jgi:hypothetical protein
VGTNFREVNCIWDSALNPYLAFVRSRLLFCTYMCAAAGGTHTYTHIAQSTAACGQECISAMGLSPLLVSPWRVMSLSPLLVSTYSNSLPQSSPSPHSTHTTHTPFYLFPHLYYLFHFLLQVLFVFLAQKKIATHFLG